MAQPGDQLVGSEQPPAGGERRYATQRNATTTLSTTSLLPFTRLVLVVSAVVQIVFGLVGLLFTNQLWNTVFWTAPLPAWPVEAMRFASLTYLATASAALYALYQGSWDGARVYFAFSFPYIVFSVVAALVTAISPGVPLIMWLYVLLSILYLPAVAYAWYQQARQARTA